MQYTTMKMLVLYILKEFASEGEAVIRMESFHKALASAFESLTHSGFVMSDAGVEKNGRWHSFERELNQARMKNLVFGDQFMNPFERHAYLYAGTCENARREINSQRVESHDERTALENAAEACYITYHNLVQTRSRFKIAG
ncbi:MAG: hypothetical protein JWN50_790 [Parcubacteria group bacterium]|nr:hypothetical protein [Parcubacteria group bacterium]